MVQNVSTKKRKPEDYRDIEVLATLLVAYPEVCRAIYDPSRKTLTLVFMCKGKLPAKKRKEIQKRYMDSVAVYAKLTKKRPKLVNCNWETMDRYSVFNVERDVLSLSPGEVSIAVDIVSSISKVIPSSEEEISGMDRDDFTRSARAFLQETLEEMRNMDSSRKLVAFREGEKVLVFDK
jgi:hypothetical protein